ncbi:MAG: DUF6869 domain-containing protein [Novosphingobium sp.]
MDFETDREIIETARIVAKHWITYSRYKCFGEFSDLEQENRFLIYKCARAEPIVAWEAIKCVIEGFDANEILCRSDTEAQEIVQHTAGPLSELLERHGPEMIAKVIQDAEKDGRIRWALSCLDRGNLSQNIWDKLRLAGNRT